MNGIPAAGRDLQDARDLAGMLVTLGLAVPPKLWVDDLKRLASIESFDALPC